MHSCVDFIYLQMSFLVVLLLIQTFIPHKPICPFSFLECPYILFSFVGSPAPISKWIHYIYSKRRTIILVTKINTSWSQKISKKMFLPYFLSFFVFFSVTFLRSQKEAIFAVLDSPPRSAFVSLHQLNVILQLHLSADQR